MHALVVTIVHHPEDARIRHRQIRALLDAGHTVTYAAPFGPFGAAPSDGITPVSLPRAVGRRRLRAISAARRVIRECRHSVDIILLHDPELLLAVWALRRLPPVVWDVHEDTAAAVSLKPWLPRPLRPLAAGVVGAAERIAERRHHLILAEEAYQARFRRPHPVVANTTHVPERVRRPGADRVVYVGHLSNARGAQDMIELARLLNGSVTVELIGAADRETHRALERAQQEDLVVWPGYLPNDVALQRVEGALAGLSLLHDEPNYRHSRPTKIIEYMARGVPVITTPIAVARELVERHGAGIVVPFEDPKAVVGAVERLRSDAELRVGMGTRGREAAIAKYSWQASGERFVRQLQEWARPS